MPPAAKPEAPNSLLYKGSIGRTIPKPTRSMNTVRNMISNEVFLAMTESAKPSPRRGCYKEYLL